jgi:hypothetical protein
MSAKAKILGSAAALALAAIGYIAPASAVPVSCKVPTNNHMLVDSSLVVSCLEAGAGNGNAGNIGQGGGNDPFLNAHAGWTNIGAGSFTQSVNTKTLSSGTFSFDSSLWDDYLTLAIGFKFGTGNQPDEWFVYDLQHLVSSGNWSFINVFKKGGGLSHIVIYGGERNDTNVPEPATLGMLGLGLLGLGFARRRKA